MNASTSQIWQYGSGIQTGAVVLSAVAAIILILSARATAKRRNTMDLILHQESDRELIEARTKFNAIKADEKRPSLYGNPENRNTEQAQTIRKVLNLHELTAVAIEERVINERVYRKWFNSTYIGDYEAMKDYIAVARKTYQNPKAFYEFERTALRWKADTDWYAKPGKIRRKWEALKTAWRS